MGGIALGGEWGMGEGMARDVPRQTRYDAVIIGSGPNGLAAALTLAREGLGVLVVEAYGVAGGGMRTAELTLPGYLHDVCSAAHPMALVSPFFRGMRLEEDGLEWVHPEVVLAHPLDGGRAAVMHRGVEETAAGLGEDGKAWLGVFGRLRDSLPGMWGDLLGPLPVLPRHPIGMMRFGRHAVRSAAGLVGSEFRTEGARALFGGNAAHSVLPLEKPLTAAVGVALGLAGQTTGWPVARGGSGSIAGAMVRRLEKLGGEVVCGWRVETLEELPAASAYLFDTGPGQMASICGGRLPSGYVERLKRFRYGPGVFKLDMALSGPIPWANAECRRAGTVHVGGNFEELAASERRCWGEGVNGKPFVLVAQQSVCDGSRAPEGKHTAWAYCHVASGSAEDHAEAVLGQMERFAPGFRDTVLATHAMGPGDYERYNANNAGGDIVGGVMDAWQLYTRPVARWNPWTTPAGDVFLCSSSTPPGPGVHGMCGWHAGKTVLRRVFGKQPSAW